MNSLLFVYGTLRKYEKNHHLLAQSACINEQARTKGSLFAAKEEPTAVFNDEGYRIGYGAGYYDRYFSDFEGETVSTVYPCQKHDFQPDNYDIPVKEVVTCK